MQERRYDVGSAVGLASRSANAGRRPPRKLSWNEAEARLGPFD